MKTRFSISLKLILLILGILTIMLLIQAYILISKQTGEEQTKLTNNAVSFSVLSADYIIKNYRLYYESGFFKYSELIRELMNLNKDLVSIQIINSQSIILFDTTELESGKYSDEGKSLRAVEDNGLLNKIRGLETAILTPESYKNVQKGVEVIQPFIDDWNRHDFSIRYTYIFKTLEARTQSIMRDIISSFLILLFLIFILVFFVTAKIVRAPLNKLLTGIHMIMDGNYTYKVDIKSKDEIGDIGERFNKMTAIVRDYNLNLENKIKERTKELEESNERLEKFNKLAVGRELKMIELKDKIKELSLKQPKNMSRLNRLSLKTK